MEVLLWIEIKMEMNKMEDIVVNKNNYIGENSNKVSKVEKAKYREHHYDKTDIDDSKLSFYDKFSINYQTIMGKGELNPFLIFLFFTLLGSIYDSLRFLYSFSLLSILSLNQTLSNIALSFLVKGS